MNSNYNIIPYNNIDFYLDWTSDINASLLKNPGIENESSQNTAAIQKKKEISQPIYKILRHQIRKVLPRPTLSEISIAKQPKTSITNLKQNTPEPTQTQQKSSDLKDQLLNKMFSNFSEINSINNQLLQQIMNPPQPSAQQKIFQQQQFFHQQQIQALKQQQQFLIQKQHQMQQQQIQQQQMQQQQMQQAAFSMMTPVMPMYPPQPFEMQDPFYLHPMAYARNAELSHYQLNKQKFLLQQQQQLQQQLQCMDPNRNLQYLPKFEYDQVFDAQQFNFFRTNFDEHELLYQPGPQFMEDEIQDLAAYAPPSFYTAQQQNIENTVDYKQPVNEDSAEHNNQLEMIKKMGSLYKQSLEMVLQNKKPSGTSSELDQLKCAMDYDRRRRVQRYLDKKKKRQSKSSKVALRYPCRKQFADNRIRVQGKFVSMAQAASIVSEKYDIKINKAPVTQQDLARLISQVSSISQSDQFKDLIKNAADQGSGNTQEKLKINIQTMPSISQQPSKGVVESQQEIMSQINKLI